jgi:hypothetical protein
MGKLEPDKYYDIDKVVCDVGTALTLVNKYLAEMGGWLTHQVTISGDINGASVDLRLEFSIPDLRGYLAQHNLPTAYIA